MSRLKQAVKQIQQVLNLRKEAQQPKAFFDSQPCAPDSNTLQPDIKYIEIDPPTDDSDRFIMFTLDTKIQLVFSLSVLMKRINAGDMTNPAFYGPSARLLGIRARFTDLQVERIRQESQCRANFANIDASTKQLSFVLLAPLVRYFVRKFPRETGDWIDNKNPYWYTNIDAIPNELIQSSVSTSEPKIVRWMFRVVQTLQFFLCVWFVPQRVLAQVKDTSTEKWYQLLKCDNIRCVWETIWSARYWDDQAWMETGFEGIFFPFQHIPRDFGPRIKFALERSGRSSDKYDLFIDLYVDLSQAVLEFVYTLFRDILDQETQHLLIVDVDTWMSQSHITENEKKHYLLSLLRHTNLTFVGLLEWIIHETYHMVQFFITPDMTCLPPA